MTCLEADCCCYYSYIQFQSGNTLLYLDSELKFCFILRIVSELHVIQKEASRPLMGRCGSREWSDLHHTLLESVNTFYMWVIPSANVFIMFREKEQGKGERMWWEETTKWTDVQIGLEFASLCVCQPMFMILFSFSFIYLQHTN